MNNETVISLPSFGKLIIFSLIFLVSCQQKKDSNAEEILIVWKDGRAAGISISKSILNNVPADSLSTQFQVRLAKPGQQPVIFGEYIITQHEVIFEPFIPFTRGLSYEIIVKHRNPVILEIPKASEVPELVAIYPSNDTLPENLLKIYFVFSRPMIKEHSLQYIKLTDHAGDSLPNIFLNLQQELWNEEGTVLTLWLDPGRIKRHLQPNQLLGPPLEKGEKYKLMISAGWPDQQGASLVKAYTKNIVATIRDTSTPSPNNWNLKLPRAGTLQAFELDLLEPHDYFLLQNTIRLFDSHGNLVNGTPLITDGEKKYSFIPAKPWSLGKYKLHIETRLEDLAGNNLSRLFDRDLRKSETIQPVTNIFEREWYLTQ
ncbi:MAG TPA: hypothetical protein VEV87_04490 [Chitinophagaceae bacterium]|nr:hypothetical protein [Chitinophagaceae bacterium]